MKTILPFLAIGSLAVGGLSSTAAADHWQVGVVVGTSVRSYLPCGCPVYSQRYIRSLNPYGYPVYDYRVLAVNHVCRVEVPLFCPPPVYCPPPVCVPYVREYRRPFIDGWSRGDHCGPDYPLSRHRHDDWHR